MRNGWDIKKGSTVLLLSGYLIIDTGSTYITWKVTDWFDDFILIFSEQIA